jgi:hypothetical protein
MVPKSIFGIPIIGATITATIDMTAVAAIPAVITFVVFILISSLVMCDYSHMNYMVFICYIFTYLKLG